MKFNLTCPCSDCPFLADTLSGWLGKARAQGLAHDIAVEGRTFACHKTTHRPQIEHSHCAGAAIMQERAGQVGQMLQIAERLGLYDPEKLDLGAPVHQDWTAFVRRHA